MLHKEQKEKTQPLSKMTNNWSKRCKSPLGKSWWKCTSPIGAAAQKEDPELNAALHWLETRKKGNLKTLLRECIMSEEGQMVWRNHQNYTSLQGTLYLCSTPKREKTRICYYS